MCPYMAACVWQMDNWVNAKTTWPCLWVKRVFGAGALYIEHALAGRLPILVHCVIVMRLLDDGEEEDDMRTLSEAVEEEEEATRAGRIAAKAAQTAPETAKITIPIVKLKGERDGDFKGDLQLSGFGSPGEGQGKRSESQIEIDDSDDDEGASSTKSSYAQQLAKTAAPSSGSSSKKRAKTAAPSSAGTRRTGYQLNPRWTRMSAEQILADIKQLGVPRDRWPTAASNLTHGSAKHARLDEYVARLWGPTCVQFNLPSLGKTKAVEVFALMQEEPV